MDVPVEETAQHVLLLLTLLGALFGVLKFARSERDRRVALLIAQREQTALLKSINHELHPNGGTSAVDRIERGVQRNADAIVSMHADNERAHFDIHRRIDGLFETLGVTASPQRIAKRHHDEREDT